MRISGKDSANNPVNELVHTLDITPNGARLGAIHHALRAGEKLTLQYRQRRIQFRVVWVKPLEGTNEYQVGLEGLSSSGDNWGLELPDGDMVDEYGLPLVHSCRELPRIHSLNCFTAISRSGAVEFTAERWPAGFSCKQELGRLYPAVVMKPALHHSIVQEVRHAPANSCPDGEPSSSVPVHGDGASGRPVEE